MTYSDEMTVIGNKANYVLGIASDYAVRIVHCTDSGQDYSVYFHAQARVTNILNVETEIMNVADNFYSCLASQMPANSAVTSDLIC